MSPSDNALILGKFAGHFGVKGWIKVVSYTRPVDEIFQYSTLWVKVSPPGREWKEVKVEQTRSQDGSRNRRLVMKLQGIDSREQAESLINCEIAVDDSQLASLPAGEYYWKQLIGLRMSNLQGENFGVIDHILETGANDVLVVNDNETKRERLVPWIDDVGLEVDLELMKIVVDWDSEF